METRRIVELDRGAYLGGWILHGELEDRRRIDMRVLAVSLAIVAVLCGCSRPDPLVGTYSQDVDFNTSQVRSTLKEHGRIRDADQALQGLSMMAGSDVTLELKSDHTFVQLMDGPKNSMVGTWKVEGQMLTLTPRDLTLGGWTSMDQRMKDHFLKPIKYRVEKGNLMLATSVAKIAFKKAGQ